MARLIVSTVIQAEAVVVAPILWIQYIKPGGLARQLGLLIFYSL